MKTNKKTNTKINYYFFYLITFFLLISCSDNEICYNKKTKLIITKNESIINKLILKEKNGDLIFINKRIKNKGFSFIDLNNVDTINYIFLNSSIKSEEIKNFSLNNNSNYKISNYSNGDAKYSHLNFETDEFGKIKNCDKNCD